MFYKLVSFTASKINSPSNKVEKITIFYESNHIAETHLAEKVPHCRDRKTTRPHAPAPLSVKKVQPHKANHPPPQQRKDPQPSESQPYVSMK